MLSQSETECIDDVLKYAWLVSATAGQIMGVAMAGFGELPRNQIRELAVTMMGMMTRLEFSLIKVSKVYGADFITIEQFPTSFIIDLYQAARHYHSTSDDKPLLELISARNDLLARLVNMRLTMRP